MGKNKIKGNKERGDRGSGADTVYIEQTSGTSVEVRGQRQRPDFGENLRLFVRGGSTKHLGPGLMELINGENN